MSQAPAAKPRNALIDQLRRQYPVFGEFRPLAIGIHKALRERMPELNVGDLRTAMRIHTQSTRYLKTMTTATERVDLEGLPAGEVTAEQRDAASLALKDRFKKAAEQRRAEEEAKRQQEKLAQLAAKFSKR